MSKPIDEILAPKPQLRQRIYAYSIDDAQHAGLLKIGQTVRDVQTRVAEQLRTAAIQNYRIELDELAERADGSLFTDHEVRAALVRKGFDNPQLEWVCCTQADVQAVLVELRTGQRLAGRAATTRPWACAPSSRRRWTRRTLTFSPCGPKTPTQRHAICGTPRCALAKPSPPTTSPRSWARAACWC